MLNNQGRIAISGKSGCGNTTVSRLVSEMLGIGMVNYTFRALAQEEGYDFEQMRAMAQKDSQWDRLLDERQIKMANKGPCVLGSRLAIWLWKESELKVYLEASDEVRARRIASREEKPFHEVLEKTRKRDQEDRERYLKLYGIDNDRPEVADLILNTEDKNPQQIAQLIVERWKETL